MKYDLNKTNYHDFAVYEVNKLPGRSYFIPYPDRESACSVSPKEKRYRSPKVQCLNGEWDFRFYPRPAELPDVLDTDETDFGRIDVPSCWQFRGYDRPFYVNIRYQFPFDPPRIPTEEKAGTVFSWLGVDQKVRPRWKDPGEEYNFVGVYRRFIDIADADRRFTVSFLGVASCLDLYLNGGFVGYSEGSHNTAEFDLTGKLTAGRNEMVAVVHRWCTGTYLEGQDMFRNNGIFRDVLLRIDEKEDFSDIAYSVKKTGDTYALSVQASVLSDVPVTFTLSGHGIERTETVPARDRTASAVFEDIPAEEWSAEAPVLYDLFFETPAACVREAVGFRTVEIRGDVFLLNGKRVKLKGVNHHDTSPDNGYTMTPEELERDLLLCREYNIDTVRTSHYPPDPLLLELADLIGIYIVDECDLETHGTFAMQVTGTYNTISHDPKWRDRYLDRISRLYLRDRDRANTSVIMWSLGNEAGGYRNTDAMYDYLKERSDLPVHYESAVHCRRIAYDVGSEMYPSVQMVRDVGEHRRRQKPLNDRPYFMCEYAHAMGVGPGNTEAYWREIYAHDNLMGGCVWEMVDHAVRHSDGSYTYGGDHGEWEHDGNFCVDGLFYPDRAPSTGAHIIRFIYRPVRVTHLGGDEYEIFNTTSFSSSARYRLDYAWNDGTSGTLCTDVPPLTAGKAVIPAGKAVDGVRTLTVTATDTVTGRVVSAEQPVTELSVPGAMETGPLPRGCRVDADGKLVVSCGGRAVVITADEGTLLYRAGTDNDTDPFFSDTMKPWRRQRERLIKTEKTENGYRIVSRITNRRGIFEVTDLYEGCGEDVLVTSRLRCLAGGGNLPRFGKCFRLESAFDRVAYFGRTGESYADMKDQFPVGRVTCRVGDMTEPNIRPQESGNRCDCTEAAVSDGSVTVRFIAADRPFELGIKPYTDRALSQMRHREDEKRTGTYVTVQAFQQGIGTGACGPGIAPEYLYKARDTYEVRFLIRTEKTEGR